MDGRGREGDGGQRKIVRVFRFRPEGVVEGRRRLFAIAEPLSPL